MPTIERVVLTHVGEAHGRREVAAAEVEILWERADIDHPFRVTAHLIEQDGRLDTYSVGADGGLIQVKRGNEDDRMGEIGTEDVTPTLAGRETYPFTREWDFPSAHEHWMEYRAVATVVSTDFVGDTRVSGMLKSTVD